jgi:hypothetical protein
VVTRPVRLVRTALALAAVLAVAGGAARALPPLRVVGSSAGETATGGPARGVAQAEPYALIVNPALGVTNVSLAEARRIFLGEQQFWPGGGRVVLFVHAPGSAGREVALRHLYRMKDDEFRRYWIAKTFRGDVASGPKLVSTDALAKRLTASIPGAITVIRASEVDDTVKVLTVDGRAPGDAGYTLMGAGK